MTDQRLMPASSAKREENSARTGAAGYGASAGSNAGSTSGAGADAR